MYYFNFGAILIWKSKTVFFYFLLFSQEDICSFTRLSYLSVVQVLVYLFYAMVRLLALALMMGQPRKAVIKAMIYVPSSHLVSNTN